jgi:uncharacterized protein YjbJ (UPF0337 family)
MHLAISTGMRTQLQGDWKQVRCKLKERWRELSDDDIDRINGQRDQLVGTLQKRYGKTLADAQRAANDFFDGLAT